ncbi:MAG TPA: NUDIX domain-containing protein [Chromatiaceae bacterium]|nr:NUDIX domain-containing protein [Chromatiaceae bacterium]
MNYCCRCGGELDLRVPAGDNRPRHVCTGCGEIHYLNPKMVTGCIPVWEDRVLLCKRAIEPRYGFWTLPAGFMENGESCQQGAARETLEEANARARIVQLYTTFNLPHINQVYLLFRAELEDLDFSPGKESLEVALFREEEVPWEELAFAVVKETLKLYFEDRRRGRYLARVGDIHWKQDQPGRYEVVLLE